MGETLDTKFNSIPLIEDQPFNGLGYDFSEVLAKLTFPVVHCFGKATATGGHARLRTRKPR